MGGAGGGGGGLFSQRAPAWHGSPGKHSTAKEELVEFGPLYGNMESLPSGFIIIMEGDTPDVLIRDVEGGNQQGGGLCGGSSSSLSDENRYNNPAY